MSRESHAFVRDVLFFSLLGAALLALIVRSIINSDARLRTSLKWAFTLVLSFLICVAVPWFAIFGFWVIVVCAALLSWMWTPTIGEIIARPFSGLYDGGSTPPEPKPAYSVAQARQKQGRNLEAIEEVRKQLARFPKDLQGHLLLAQIQAEGLKDLSAAEETIQEFCLQPGHAPANIAFCLYSMADWYLQIARNRESAKRVLEQVVLMLPETEFALTAAQRIAHLSYSAMVLNPSEQKFTVPEANQRLGLTQQSPKVGPEEPDPGRKAADYVQHLTEHPLDTEAREQLAIIYADYYGRLDLASEQLEQLIELPHQSMKSIARWLNLLADLQLRCGAGYDAVRATLQRIIDRAPNFAAAENARKRIDLLRLELKALEKSKDVRLGTYEQNLGLKQNRWPNQRPPPSP